MKAPDFRYERPASVEAALALLADDAIEAAPLAGGQSLMPMMNFRVAAPEMLVDLNALDGLAGVTVADGWLEIGAMTRWRTLETSDEVARAAPLVAKALPHIAHPAIRNRGTIGGSVALADPAAEIPAVIVAMGGEVVLRGQGGARTLGAADFFRGVYETAREPGELVTAMTACRWRAPGTRTGFCELARRHGDYAMAGCCVVAGPDGVTGGVLRHRRPAGARRGGRAGAGGAATSRRRWRLWPSSRWRATCTRARRPSGTWRAWSCAAPGRRPRHERDADRFP